MALKQFIIKANKVLRCKMSALIFIIAFISGFLVNLRKSDSKGKDYGIFKQLFGIQDKPKADFLNSSVRTGETKIYNVE